MTSVDPVPVVMVLPATSATQIVAAVAVAVETLSVTFTVQVWARLSHALTVRAPFDAACVYGLTAPALVVFVEALKPRLAAHAVVVVVKVSESVLPKTRLPAASWT